MVINMMTFSPSKREVSIPLIGFNHVDFPAGIILLDALLKKNVDLKTSLPSLTQTLKDERLRALFNTSLDGHPGWSKYDFGFQQDYNGQDSIQKQRTDFSCDAIETML